MKKALLIAVLCLTTAPAFAESEVINLPGNAKVVTGSNNDSVVIRGYDTDDILYRRLINPNAGTYHYRGNYNRVPNNEAASVCGGIERERKRERCLDDVRKEREKLMRKYN